MFEHGLNTEFGRGTSIHWHLMSFLSGSVNAGGFLACERFVTHTTGFATLSGIHLARGDLVGAFAAVSVPLFFLGGVMIAARLTVARIHRQQRPLYSLTMGLVALCLLVAALGGNLDMFGEFGTNFYLRHNFLLIALLCMASGLQNAALTTSSGATIRTTHLTGITTDLGIGLMEAMEKRHDRRKFREVSRLNQFRIGSIMSFSFGGAAGAALFDRYQYWGFLLPMAIACYAAYVARNLGKPLDPKNEQITPRALSFYSKRKM